MSDPNGRRRVAILISGRGSNMAALIEAAREPGYPAAIVLVLSNAPDAGGLATAKAAGIPTAVVEHRAYGSRESFDEAVGHELAAHAVDLVCLAGFMRIFGAAFVERWRGRMLNVHPSLLPAFKGLHPHRQALQAGVRIHGCTVHFVVPELDSGPIVAQAAIPVVTGDTQETLAARLIGEEHALYAAALRIVASGAATLRGDLVEVAAGETTAFGLG